MVESGHFLLGPFFKNWTDWPHESAEMTATGWCMEFSTEEEQFIVPVYLCRRQGRPQPYLEDYMFHESDCPFTVRYYQSVQSHQTAEGLFISVSKMLGTMYDLHGPTCSAFKLFDEFATRLPFTSMFQRETPDSTLLVQPLAAQGYCVETIRQNGDAVEVVFCWIPPCATAEGRIACNFVSGGITFRPRHNGSLGNGTWYSCRPSTPSFHLFELLKRHAPARPIESLSSAGVERCLSVFTWQERHRKSKAELEDARTAFIRTNPSLWETPLLLAGMLKQEGLYSDWTSAHQIAKTVKKWVSKFRAEDGC